MVVESFKYLRFGECKRCGFCCGQKRCPDFAWVDGVAVCKVYGNGDMPVACKLYPENPPILTDSCGYRFVDKLHRRKLEANQV